MNVSHFINLAKTPLCNNISYFIQVQNDVSNVPFGRILTQASRKTTGTTGGIDKR
jgi:hypothetical protein